VRKITTQMPSSHQAALRHLLAKQSVASSECGNTLDGEKNSGFFSLNPFRKRPISDAEMAIDRELEDILRAHPQSDQCSLSDDIFFLYSRVLLLDHFLAVLSVTSASTSSLVNPVQELITDTPGIVPTLCFMTQKTEAD